jgi:hypothetical protein
MFFYSKKHSNRKYYHDEKYTINDSIGPTRYQMFDDGLSFIKSQQWTTAYYILLVQGSIIAFHTVFISLKTDYTILIIETIFLTLASLSTMCIGFDIISGYSEKLKEYRCHVDKLLRGKLKKHKEKDFEKFLTRVFYVIFFVTSVFVILYLWISHFY